MQELVKMTLISSQSNMNDNIIDGFMNDIRTAFYLPTMRNNNKYICKYNCPPSHVIVNKYK